METLRLFALTNLPWIREQRRRMQAQPRLSPRTYTERESHYLWGDRYLLSVKPSSGKARVELCPPNRLALYVRSDAPVEARKRAVEAWYRERLREASGPLVEAWSKRMDVTCRGLFVQQMKTKWGSCSTERGTIRLNTDLARKPVRCLEYVIVHELAHFIERRHNARFFAVLKEHLPDWQHRRDLLARLPLPDTP